MFTLDGTDTAWLIYADYLDDNGNYQQAELVREEVLEENNAWGCEYRELWGVGGIKWNKGVGYGRNTVGDGDESLGETDVGCGVGCKYFGGTDVGDDD